jgi:hypothetical protein
MTDADNFPVPPVELKERVTGSLRASGVLRPRPHWSRAPLAVAAGVALFVAGTQVSRPGTGAANDQPAFALMLYEDDAFQPTITPAQIVSEYTSWAGGMAERGELVLAEELDPVVQVVGADAPTDMNPLGQLTGMFVVHAADREAALELARHHPHVRHGGRIVVRGFVRRG